MSNPEKIELLADWLEKQTANSKITDGRIWQKMAMSERSFYRMKPKAVLVVQARAQERQKLINDTKAAETIEAVKTGLKSKAERVMLLQMEVDNCLKELHGDESVKNFAIVGGKLVNVKNQLTIEQKLALRKVIKELQAEISKIEGDYAPTKQEVTGKGGKPIRQDIKRTVVFKKYGS